MIASSSSALQPTRSRLSPFGSALVLIALLASALPAHAQERSWKRKKGGDLIEKTLLHEEIERQYYLHLPPEFDKETASPLLLALHGGGGKAKSFDRGTWDMALTQLADRHGMVVVFPQGVDSHWSDGRKEQLEEGKEYDDIGFLSRIIDSMVADYGVDADRVYVLGISNGGFMTMRVAMELSGKVAAVAAVTAQVSKALAEERPEHPISVMLVNGTEDPIVPYDGGVVRVGAWGKSRGEILSTDATVELFRFHLGCEEEGTTTSYPDRDPKDGTRVEKTIWADGKAGSEVVLVKVIGGGHTWPGGKQYLGKRLVGRVSRDIDASQVIVEFFLRHPRPTTIPPAETPPTAEDDR